MRRKYQGTTSVVPLGQGIELRATGREPYSSLPEARSAEALSLPKGSGQRSAQAEPIKT